MKILVTGETGQLGSEVVSLLSRHSEHSVFSPARSQLDLSWPANQIEQYICELHPDAIINCAAMTAVDDAETHIDLAMQINRDGPEAIARAANDCNARLLHLSTDYVFAGDKGSPYSELDATAPINVYGQSKLAGEQAVLGALPDAVIVRTSWVYGTRGKNFVKTILDICQRNPEQPLRIVNDQIGSPTYARDLALACIRLVDRQASGLFHFTNDGVCSWYDFALALVDEARAAGFDLPDVEIHSTNSASFPRPARRPSYSVLSKEKIFAVLADPVSYPKIPHWRESLKEMLSRLRSQLQ